MRGDGEEAALHRDRGHQGEPECRGNLKSFSKLCGGFFLGKLQYNTNQGGRNEYGIRERQNLISRK